MTVGLSATSVTSVTVQGMAGLSLLSPIYLFASGILAHNLSFPSNALKRCISRQHKKTDAHARMHVQEEKTYLNNEELSPEQKQAVLTIGPVASAASAPPSKTPSVPKSLVYVDEFVSPVQPRMLRSGVVVIC